MSIYPHAGHVVERVGDAVRLAEQTGRKNVGVTFNLCHWLRAEGTGALEETLRRALPRLTMVTINGANRDGKEWIQPLDSGDFDAAALLDRLRILGYRGPIGLQGYGAAARYGIGPLDNLKRSMAAWKRFAARTAAP